MSERGWIILFSVLCVLSGVLALVSWCNEWIWLAVQFGFCASIAFIGLIVAIHQATKEGR